MTSDDAKPTGALAPSGAGAPAPSTALPDAAPGEAPGGGPEREDGAPWRNFHGRRHGKTLRKGQVEHLETTLAEVAVPNVTWADNPERKQIDPAAMFKTPPREIWLEVGFGGGEHMLGVGEANPDVGVIGCEPFINGVAMLLSHMTDRGIENVRVHAGDARDLMDVLPAGSMDRAFLLYPDPWPKTRHHKRRFMNPDNLDQLATVLRPGAELRVATDIPDYARHSLAAAFDHPAFEWLAERPGDWNEPWEGWVRTRYEAKALREGRTPCYLRFRRK
ncbi:tRNA (guanine(46)-N(7))-methyltransferase TrmB [Rhodovulum sp. DZ06]|uniref:tRNA (guanine(46)-N(7))-methyltransferase TrmB n=1 Tax=Rhodovulum sp. DZ06 TaxID=3425126 RepID=UPI003D347C3B